MQRAAGLHTEQVVALRLQVHVEGPRVLPAGLGAYGHGGLRDEAVAGRRGVRHVDHERDRAGEGPRIDVGLERGERRSVAGPVHVPEQQVRAERVVRDASEGRIVAVSWAGRVEYTVAVVVDQVTDLDSVRVDVLCTVVAVVAAVAGRVYEAVAIGVDDSIIRVARTVLVDHVPAQLGRPRGDVAVAVVTVRAPGAGGIDVAVSVEVVGTVVRITRAVLVDGVAAHLRRARSDTAVAVVAVRAPGAGDIDVAVSVEVVGAVVGVARAVLVGLIAAELHGTRTNRGVGVVAVRPAGAT